MGIAKRIAAAAVGLVLLLVVAAVVFLPRLIASDAVKEQLSAAINEAAGSEVRYAGLDVGIFPPSLLIEEVAVAGATAGAPDWATAERIALRVALMPLFAGVVLVDSLAVDGLKANLVRNADGIALPSRSAAVAEEAELESEAEGAGVDVAIARFELNDAYLSLEDRTVSPSVTWDLRDFDLAATGTSLDEPIDFELSTALGSGGQITAKGTATFEGEVDVEVRLTDLAINPAGFYIDDGNGLAGIINGTLTARGPADDLEVLRIEGSITDALLPMGDTKIAGRVKIAADISAPLSAPSGKFDVDATAAEVRYSDVFTKPAGETGTVTGKIAGGKNGGLSLDDVRLKIKNLDATVGVKTGARTRIEIDAPPFDLAGWDALVPALADYDLSGPARIEKMVITTAPLDVRGALVLDGVSGVLPDSGPVRIDGALVGEGTAVNSRDLRVVAADQPIDTVLSLRDIGGNPQYRVQLRTDKADTNQLVSAFSSKRDFVYGMLDLDGDLRGTVGGSQSTLETLNGRVLLNIDKGRLKGVSILQLTFDSLGSMGAVAALASALFGGPDLTPYFEDDFKEIRGTLDVVDGVVNTDDLRIVYRDYIVDLRGRLRLADLAVDMTGLLTLGDRIEKSLGRDGDPNAPDTIELARVTGTLDEPQVAVSPEVAMAFLNASPGGKVVDDAVGGAIDDAVGEEAGALLKGILGGALKKR